MSEIAVSVTICTRNRADSLARTLGSMRAMDTDAAWPWELVIIDNGSNDHTESVVASFAESLPVRRVFEPRGGLSVARNCAVASVRGRFIVGTDDDVLVDRDWLMSYRRALSAWPDTALFGGRIIPQYDPQPPTWFTGNMDIMGGPVARRDFGDATMLWDASTNHLPYGANFAAPSDVMRRFPFDPDLGAGPGRRRTYEEIQVFAAILNSGLTGRYVPESIVHHVIAADRQTPAYVMRYFDAVGESMAYFENVQHPRLIAGAPPYLWRHFARQWLRHQVARGVGDARRWLVTLRDYHQALGYLRATRRRTGEGPAKDALLFANGRAWP